MVLVRENFIGFVTREWNSEGRARYEHSSSRMEEINISKWMEMVLIMTWARESEWRGFTDTNHIAMGHTMQMFWLEVMANGDRCFEEITRECVQETPRLPLPWRCHVLLERIKVSIACFSSIYFISVRLQLRWCLCGNLKYLRLTLAQPPFFFLWDFKGDIMHGMVFWKHKTDNITPVLKIFWWTCSSTLICKKHESYLFHPDRLDTLKINDFFGIHQRTEVSGKTTTIISGETDASREA